MRAMIFEKAKSPLTLQEIAKPTPNSHELLLKVTACGVCRTDLHIIDGELKNPKTPLVLGHQIVGIVEGKGDKVTNFSLSDKIGVPWLGKSCEKCSYCIRGEENLCDSSLYTGYQINGGFAEYCVADSRYCFSLPKGYTNPHVAPLLCAGLIGYRSYRLCNQRDKIGFYGFGSAAHILLQLAKAQGKKVYVFTKKGDSKGQKKALSLGAFWAGDSESSPPDLLEAAIIFAPVGSLVPQALKALAKGGKVICAGIHMSDIPSFPYSILWGERSIQSIANLTRKDGEEFMKIAEKIPIHTSITTYPLEKANEALEDLKKGKIEGSAVIIPN